jgi:hypothetical protein
MDKRVARDVDKLMRVVRPDNDDQMVKDRLPVSNAVTVTGKEDKKVVSKVNVDDHKDKINRPTRTRKFISRK